MALTVVGVILLGMALVAYNEYSTEPKPTKATAQSEVNTSTSSSPEDASKTEIKPITKPAQSTAALTPPTAPANVEDWSKNAPLAPSTPSPIAPSAETLAPATTPATDSEATKPASQAPSIEAKPEVAPEAPKATPAEPKEVAKVEEKPKEAEKPQAKPTTSEEKKPEPAKPAVAKAIKKISILSIGNGVTVRLDSTQVPPYKSMQLKDPPRIVLDLTGDWKVKAPGVPKNDFVSNVRIGQQKDGTRIVIDLKKTPASVRYLKYGDNGLDVRIR